MLIFLDVQHTLSSISVWKQNVGVHLFFPSSRRCKNFFTISGFGWEVRSDNWLLALRGHVTNASFKQWLGILLMPKIDIAHKHISYPRNLTGNACKGDILWHKVVWFVLAAMLEGILLPSNMAAKTTFFFYLVKRFIVSLRCSVNVTTSSFQHFPWSLSVKFVFRKR